MPESEARRTALHHFSAVPHRAFSDKRLKSRHFRVLGAICIAVDRETAHARISQARIASWGSISRPSVTPVVDDLEAWGYISRVARGRSKRGKFKTLIYAVHYDAPPPAHSAPGGDTVHVTHVGDTSVSPPEAAESDSSISDIKKGSDSQAPGISCTSPRRNESALARSDEETPIGIQATNHAVNASVAGTTGPVRSSIGKDASWQEVAISNAEAFERSHRNAAEDRICKELFKNFQGPEAAPALVAVRPELYELAVDAELRQRGAGVSMVIRSVKKKLRRMGRRK